MEKPKRIYLQIQCGGEFDGDAITVELLETDEFITYSTERVFGNDLEYIEIEEYNRLLEEVGRLRVQLAGCSVAAIGYAENPPLDSSAYGWSVAYQDVANLYERYENLLEENARLQAAFIFESAFNAPEPQEVPE